MSVDLSEHDAWLDGAARRMGRTFREDPAECRQELALWLLQGCSHRQAWLKACQLYVSDGLTPGPRKDLEERPTTCSLQSAPEGALATSGGGHDGLSLEVRELMDTHLTEDEAWALQMQALVCLTIEDIAAILDCSTWKVHTVLESAKAKMREALT